MEHIFVPVNSNIDVVELVREGWDVEIGDGQYILFILKKPFFRAFFLSPVFPIFS